MLRAMIYFSLDFCTRSNKKKKFLFQGNPSLFIPYFGTSSYHTIENFCKNFYQNCETSEHGLENLDLARD